jgi:hypothetical protein
MKKSTRSAVVTLVGFLAVVIGAEVAARAWLPAIPPDAHTWPRAEIGQKLLQIDAYEERGEAVDVLFVGSSQMAASTNPQLFTDQTGLSSYNAAFAGPSMRTVGRWLLDIVEPKLSPDVVVVGIASRDSNDRSRKNKNVHQAFLNSPGYREPCESIRGMARGRKCLHALSPSDERAGDVPRTDGRRPWSPRDPHADRGTRPQAGGAG